MNGKIKKKSSPPKLIKRLTVDQVHELLSRCSEPPFLIKPSSKTPPKNHNERITQEQRINLLPQHKLVAESLKQFALGGDECAGEMLYLIALLYITALREVTNKRPSVLHSFSTRSCDWPALRGINESFHEGEWLEQKEKLQLGKNININLVGLKRGSASAQDALTILLWLTAQRENLSLPELTKRSWELWFETGWSLFNAQRAKIGVRHQSYDDLRKQAAENVRNRMEDDNEKAVGGEVIRLAKQKARTSFKKLTDRAL